MKWVKNNVFAIVLGMVLGIILLSLLPTKCMKFKMVTDTVEVVTIRYDTIFPDTIFRTLILDVENPPVQVRDSIIFDTLKVLSDLKIRLYEREFTDEWAVIKSKIKVYGHLLDVDMTYANLKPDVLKTVTVERTITDRVLQRGLFVGVYAGTESIIPQVNYLTRKGWMYGYQYNVVTGRHSIGVSKKIF